MTYTVTGYTAGGWDRKQTATSLKTAARIASEYRAALAPQTGSRVIISRADCPVHVWAGAESGRWMRVTA